MLNLLAWLHWDPPRFAFTVPIINRPIAWYGILFSLGFVLGLFIIIPMFRRKLASMGRLLERDVADWNALIAYAKTAQGQKGMLPEAMFQRLSSESRAAVNRLKMGQHPNMELRKEILAAINAEMQGCRGHLSRQDIEALFPKAIYRVQGLATYLADRLTWFVVAATVIGARLGHVFFYDWPHYREAPLDIFKVWEGGLASHGGTIGIMLALYLYLRMIRGRFPEFTFIGLLDILCVPTALVAVCIRIGNFFNQEIVGPVTTMPWAIIFQHPSEDSVILPRHPAQLYEAIAYLFTFCVLYRIWKTKGENLRQGLLIGLFMIMVFGSRFLIEFLKMPQSMVIDESWLNMGQYLSLPFIALGCAFLYLQKRPFPLERKA